MARSGSRRVSREIGLIMLDEVADGIGRATLPAMTVTGRISPNVIDHVDHFADAYANAEPFPHVVIDDFLDPAFCNRLIEAFPPFERGCAVNEHGELGGKATCENVRELGPAYVDADDLVRSDAFLKLVSRITGIDDLIYDPEYLGGGTHENKSGQELDPHVDFNFHPRTGWHRRFNAIVYLNPEWRAEWGGAIELHRDPWHPGSDDVKRVLPIKNRCVLFETSERSWHGFRAIRPPHDRRDITRRSFAIYLYTKDRLREQTAAPHATVYVERPLPETIDVGSVLGANDADLVMRLITRRRMHIDRLFERERRFQSEAADVIERLGEIESLPLSEAHVDAIRAVVQLQDEHLAALYDREKRFAATLRELRQLVPEEPGPRRFPLTGPVTLDGEVSGFWTEDRWAAKTLTVPILPREPISRLVLTGFVPDQAPSPIRLEASVGLERSELRVQHGVFSWEIPTHLTAGESARLVVLAHDPWSPAEMGSGSDARELSFIVTRVVAS
jgi:hypothetical protein